MERMKGRKDFVKHGKSKAFQRHKLLYLSLQLECRIKERDMPFILTTSLPAQSSLLHFGNMVLELLVLYELAKPGGKSMMKTDRESKAYRNWPRMMPRMIPRMIPRTIPRMMPWTMPWTR